MEITQRSTQTVSTTLRDQTDPVDVALDKRRHYEDEVKGETKGDEGWGGGFVHVCKRLSPRNDIQYREMLIERRLVNFFFLKLDLYRFVENGLVTSLKE